ncbi:MAG: xanthine dehydrogenase family protein subunit M [Rhodospirillales bacterium]|nr:xanthine dehydrogenase family protein subunit M [Rhodospirillales bacterium]
MRYEAPSTLEDAVKAAAAEPGVVRFLAGGTDLLVQLRSGMVEPDLVVDLKRIPETRRIAVEDGGFRIGAAVCGAEIGEHPALGTAWPGVVEATQLIGSTQIQGRASLGGNLCNASPAADSVPALIAAAAVAAIAGPNGRREVPVEALATGPGTTSLARDEILVSIFLPRRPTHAGDAYLRFIPRSEMDIAVVGAGVSLTLDGGICSAARIALGAVAERAILVPAAAEAIVGTAVDEAALSAAAAAASAACRPIDDKRGTKAYRTKVAGVLTRRATEIALRRARAGS